MKKNQHVLPHGKDWAIKGAGNVKYTKIVPTQKQAIDLARKIAKNQKSELIIHKKDGTIREKDSLGNDPRNIKG